jgi:hypothetical protein
MNTAHQFDPHPDADLLNGFAERALHDADRNRIVSHLASCSRCREIVFLAQQGSFALNADIAHPAPAPTASTPSAQRLPFFLRRRPLAWATAGVVACTAFVVVVLGIHDRRQVFETATAAQPQPRASAPPEQPATSAPIMPTDATRQLKTSPPPSRKADSLAANGALTVKPPRGSASARAALPAQTEAVTVEPPALSPVRPKAGAAGVHSAASQGASPILSAAPAAGLLPPAPSAPSQTNDRVSPSQFSGTIVDATGAVIAGATVQVRSVDSPVQRTTQSDSNGSFVLSGLPAGNYRLSVSDPGFQSKEMPVTMAAEASAPLHISLAVGSSSETVSVQGQAGSLAPASASAPTQAPASTPSAGPAPAPQPAQAMASPAPPPSEPAKSANQTVAVTDQAAPIQIESQAIDSSQLQKVAPVAASGIALRAVAPVKLPSGLPSASTAASASLRLALDTAGALFLSRDRGKTWEPVTKQWTGAATGVRVASPRASFAAVPPCGQTEEKKKARPTRPAVFELVNDANAVWTSTDGKTWKPK